MYGISGGPHMGVYHIDRYWSGSVNANSVFITDSESKAEIQLEKIIESHSWMTWGSLNFRVFEFSEETLEQICFLKLRGGRGVIVD